MEFPNTGLVSERDENQTKGLSSSGIFVMPGKYQLSLSKNVDGVITPLAEPVSFELKELDNRTIPAENRADLVTFKRKALQLNNALAALNMELRTLSNKIDMYKAASKAFEATEAASLLKEADALNADLMAVQNTLNGDRDYAPLDMDEMLSLRRRASSAIYDIYNSTSNIPGEARKNFELASEDFKGVLKQVESLKAKCQAMDNKLDKLGAPITPDRLPK